MKFTVTTTDPAGRYCAWHDPEGSIIALGVPSGERPSLPGWVWTGETEAEMECERDPDEYRGRPIDTVDGLVSRAYGGTILFALPAGNRW